MAGRFSALLLAALACCLFVPGVAVGATWPVSPPSGVALGFGDTYRAADGRSARHSGVDIEAAAGSGVVAPVSGVVSFSGSVPAAGGGTMCAVTIEMPHGRKVSLLPLEAPLVLAGDRVEEGARVGFLARGGDASWEGSHLHVGLRDATGYIDPLGLLVSPVSPDVSSAESGSAEGVDPSGAGSPGVSHAPASVSVGGLAPQGAPAPVAASVSSPIPASSHSVARAASGTAPAVPAALVHVPVTAAPSAALLRAEAELPGAPIAASLSPRPVSAAVAAAVPIPLREALRVAPALAAAGLLFVGYQKRPRLSCVTPPGDTVAAVVGR